MGNFQTYVPLQDNKKSGMEMPQLCANRANAGSYMVGLVRLWYGRHNTQTEVWYSNFTGFVGNQTEV